MPPIYSPLDIYLDTETERADVFTMVFTFSLSTNTPPRSLLLSRGPEDPAGTVWIQPDDEDHGFLARDVRWETDGLLLTITLSGEDRFYWDESQAMTIELFETRVDGVHSCLSTIFEPPVLEPPAPR
ncbi:hypothetical protein [Corynebacterium nasicanis]|uniref:Uncharacterized protein n=1 Tax=Corynebacterium nasicanis TaxID=1448267 RepID=A0ABW1QA01_9CORY